MAVWACVKLVMDARNTGIHQLTGFGAITCMDTPILASFLEGIQCPSP